MVLRFLNRMTIWYIYCKVELFGLILWEKKKEEESRNTVILARRRGRQVPGQGRGVGQGQGRGVRVCGGAQRRARARLIL